jgi:hypothetical protein
MAQNILIEKSKACNGAIIMNHSFILIVGIDS